MIKTFDAPDNLTGKGAVVGVCDSWCDLSHPSFSGKNISTRSFLAGKPVISNNSHGTHVIGIISSIAPDCTIEHAETACLGRGSYTDVHKALEWFQSRNIHVLNLSMSFGKDVPEIKELLDRMCGKGVIICASGDGCGAFPAQYESVISVGSHFSDSSSSDTYAPGEFLSAAPGGIMAKMSGSSASCACISAVAAMFVEEGGGGKVDFLDWLNKKAGTHNAPAKLGRHTCFIS